jgi:sugar (pentulose or hexulose) kinase
MERSTEQFQAKGTGGSYMTPPFFLGIDVGTQGARAVLIDVKGNVIADSEEDFPLDQSREEQSPYEWWHACLRSLQKLITSAKPLVNLIHIKAVSVTSTSGTVIPIDEQNEPLHNAIMYSDKRSAAEGALCREKALQFNNIGYTGFNSSSGLSKMVWFVNNFPAEAKRINKWIHAADFITGKLSGSWAVTDYTNSLKSGYDLQRNEWPEYLYSALPLKKEWLPTVVASGTPVGTLDPLIASQLGLEEGIQVVAGMTDGCASQIASGAVNPGDWNTTIGTTMVVKGVTKSEIKDPSDRVYSHRHPEGYWMPGGASNIGADWVTKDFKDDLQALNDQAKQLIPTGKLAYPLRQQGERFPFIAPDAQGFEPEGLSKAERFTANMEGVAYVERYAYQMIEKLCNEKVKAVYTAGGASNSNVWLMIRSNVLNLPIYKMKYVTGSVGAAILAASKTHFTSIIEATQALTQIEKEIHPQQELAQKYNSNYQRFLQVLLEKGYIKNEAYA